MPPWVKGLVPSLPLLGGDEMFEVGLTGKSSSHWKCALEEDSLWLLGFMVCGFALASTSQSEVLPLISSVNEGLPFGTEPSNCEFKQALLLIERFSQVFVVETES